MKEFCCDDVVPGCGARFRAETDEEILHAVAGHACRDHGLADVPAELVVEIRAAIRVAA